MSNKAFSCLYYPETKVACWLSALTTNGALRYPIPFRNPLEKCFPCTVFREVLARGLGRRQADQILPAALTELFEQLETFQKEVDATSTTLRSRVEQLLIFKKVSDALSRTTDLEKGMQIILTGVTAGEAYGFNRAFLFLVNLKRNLLEGKYAMGPQDDEEARTIWEELEKKRLSLDAMLAQILKEQTVPQNALSQRISQVSLPLYDPGNVISLAVTTKRSYNVSAPLPEQFGHKDLALLIGSNPMVVVPIVCEDRALGAIVADNYITHYPITDEALTGLETFAYQVAAQIANSLLHRELELKLEELEHLQVLLRENQNYLMQHERLADIGKLATTVAHEIKTPLVSIGGHARRALKRLGLQQPVEKELLVITTEVERLESITSEILDYSKKIKLEPELYDLKKIVTDTLAVVEGNLQLHNITAAVECDCSPEETLVFVDAKRIQQVLFNLIENAIDAMPQGGKLTLHLIRQGAFVTLAVIDTGTGIPEEIKCRLFDPFFTTKAKGSGLGLPVSKKILTDHGGSIEVESLRPGGSRFVISLPTPPQPTSGNLIEVTSQKSLPA